MAYSKAVLYAMALTFTYSELLGGRRS